VDDPYNMYFTPDGRYAIVVAEARQHLDFRDPRTFALEHRIRVDCAGVDHIDFAASGAYLIATCEFAGRLVRVDLHTLTAAGYLDLPGSAPQDIKLDPAGRTFYVADKNHAGVWLIDAATFRPAGFIPTGPDAHGLYPSRDARYLYVTNRGNGSITVIGFADKKVVSTWRIPGGGSPPMFPGRDGVVAVRALRLRRLRHLHRHRSAAVQDPGGAAAARAVRVAPAGPLLAGSYRDHSMSMPRPPPVGPVVMDAARDRR
jgi:DNA-binding beta-propeller fold protein YncE